jgi:hypothetical protein
LIFGPEMSVYLPQAGLLDSPFRAASLTASASTHSVVMLVTIVGCQDGGDD